MAGRGTAALGAARLRADPDSPGQRASSASSNEYREAR